MSAITSYPRCTIYPTLQKNVSLESTQQSNSTNKYALYWMECNKLITTNTHFSKKLVVHGMVLHPQLLLSSNLVKGGSHHVHVGTHNKRCTRARSSHFLIVCFIIRPSLVSCVTSLHELDNKSMTAGGDGIKWS